MRITHPFRLSCREITRGQFRQFVKETQYQTDAERDGQGGNGLLNGTLTYDPQFIWSADQGFSQTDDHPVMNISWNDASAFCQWLSDKEGVEFTLPTEAQWEYACRAGTTTERHCGDEPSTPEEFAWFVENAGRKTHPVGLLRPNRWQLHDLHGNVWELCADRWHPSYYNQSPTNDPCGPTSGAHHVIRGGHWLSHAYVIRSAFRNMVSQNQRDSYTGFRPVLLMDTDNPPQITPSPPPEPAKP